MKEKGKGYKMQGEARKYSANQPVAKLRTPYFQGLITTSIVFREAGKLEKIMCVGKNKTILEINVGGNTRTITYKGKIPKSCRKHLVLIYEQTKAGRERTIQVWDQTTGRHYGGASDKKSHSKYL